jgi:hypothetical protein
LNDFAGRNSHLGESTASHFGVLRTEPPNGSAFSGQQQR